MFTPSGEGCSGPRAPPELWLWLSTAQQPLEHNELSPTVLQLSKLCGGAGCPVRFPLIQRWGVPGSSEAQPGAKIHLHSPGMFVGRGASEGWGKGGDSGFKFFAEWLFAGGICCWFCFVMALLL